MLSGILLFGMAGCFDTKFLCYFWQGNTFNLRQFAENLNTFQAKLLFLFNQLK